MRAFTLSLFAAAITLTISIVSETPKAQAAKPVKSVSGPMKSKTKKRKKIKSLRFYDSNVDFSGRAYARENSFSSPLRLASAGGLARRLPEGLQTASPDVQIGCLRPQLVSMLATIQHRFGRPVIITSGYRSPSHNHKINGAEGSLHMLCAAADIKVAGVSKWDVAKFVRGLPNRGGVGTYCHQAVHIDLGSRRDWNWGCSRRH